MPRSVRSPNIEFGNNERSDGQRLSRDDERRDPSGIVGGSGISRAPSSAPRVARTVVGVCQA